MRNTILTKNLIILLLAIISMIFVIIVNWYESSSEKTLNNLEYIDDMNELNINANSNKLFTNTSGSSEELPPQNTKTTNDINYNFVSLKKNTTYLRAGPGKTYPITWVYHKKNLPLKIIAELNNWRKVQDWQGTIGWVNTIMLSSARSAIVNSDFTKLYKKPELQSPVIAKLSNNVIINIVKCKKNDPWCNINVEYEKKSYNGWILRKFLWGVNKHQQVN